MIKVFDDEYLKALSELNRTHKRLLSSNKKHENGLFAFIKKESMVKRLVKVKIQSRLLELFAYKLSVSPEKLYYYILTDVAKKFGDWIVIDLTKVEFKKSVGRYNVLILNGDFYLYSERVYSSMTDQGPFVASDGCFIYVKSHTPQSLRRTEYHLSKDVKIDRHAWVKSNVNNNIFKTFSYSDKLNVRYGIFGVYYDDGE